MQAPSRHHDPGAIEVVETREQIQDHDRVGGMPHEGREVREGEAGHVDGEDHGRARSEERRGHRRLQPAGDREDQEHHAAVDGGAQQRHRDLGAVPAQAHQRPGQHVEHRRVRERVPVPVLHLEAEAVPVLVRGELPEERPQALARELPREQRVDLDVGIVELRVQQHDQPQRPARPGRPATSAPATHRSGIPSAPRTAGHRPTRGRGPRPRDVGRRCLRAGCAPRPRHPTMRPLHRRRARAPRAAAAHGRKRPARRGSANAASTTSTRRTRVARGRATLAPGPARSTVQPVDCNAEGPRVDGGRLDSQNERVPALEVRQVELQRAIGDFRVRDGLEDRNRSTFRRQCNSSWLNKMTANAHPQPVAGPAQVEGQTHARLQGGPVEARAAVPLPVDAEPLDVVGVVGPQVQDDGTRPTGGQRRKAAQAAAAASASAGEVPRHRPAIGRLDHQHGRVVVADPALQDLLPLHAGRLPVEAAVLVRRADVLAVLDAVDEVADEVRACEMAGMSSMARMRPPGASRRRHSSSTARTSSSGRWCRSPKISTWSKRPSGRSTRAGVADQERALAGAAGVVDVAGVQVHAHVVVAVEEVGERPRAAAEVEGARPLPELQVACG